MKGGFFLSCQAQEHTVREIKVPYALSWGDAVEKLHDLIHAVQGHEIGSSEKIPGRVIFEVEGLGVGDPLLKKSLFTFRSGSLTEVELQYNDVSWDGSKTVDFFDRTRRRIDERYGPGTLIVNRVKECPPGENIPKDATYTLIIYRWAQPAIALELDYYSMEEKEQACRLVSLHYKTP
jgi:hypothetical protein